MVTFENLSRNLTTIISEVLNIQNACKLLLNDIKDPYSTNDIGNTSALINNRIKPVPFDLADSDDDKSELRVFYPQGVLKGNQIIGDISIHFDIVVAKDLWVIGGEGYSSIRAYDIANYLTNHFQNKSFSGIGKLHFDKGFVHLTTGTKFDILRLFATMTVGK